MTTTFAKRHDLDIQSDVIVYRYLNALGSEHETICKTAKESHEFLWLHPEFITDAISCMCDVNCIGDLVIWSSEAFNKDKRSERIYDVNDQEIRDLISKGLTYAQARRYVMHKDGMSISAIALIETTGRSTIQDSIELARKKIE